MEVRNYADGDRDAVILLWSQVLPGTGHNDPTSSLKRKLEADDLLFVAEEDARIVGAAMAGYDGHRGWLYSIAVDPACRRRGIGAALVRHAVDALTSLGCPKVNLQVLPENAAAVAFYESLGFVVEERISMGKRTS